MTKTSKARILFVAPLPPPVHGSSMVSQQIRESKLINDEFDCDFVNMSTSRKMSEIGRSSPVVLVKKIGRFLGAYFCCLWQLLRHQYQLCYLAIVCNGIGFIKDAPFVLLCKLFGCRVVIHLHNKGVKDYIDKHVYRKLLRWVFRDTKVILLSEYLYADISRMVDRKDVLICPNGITQRPVEEKQSLAVPELLFLSNLIESKGVYVLLDACKILKERGLQFHCTFVGGISKQIDKETFQKAVQEREIGDIVEYVGPKYGDDKEFYWRRASIFVFPTFYYNECFPLVLLEAMQHQVAIVSSDEGGIRDIVSEGTTGFLVESSVLKATSCNEVLGSNASARDRERSRLFSRQRGEQTAEAIEHLLMNRELCDRFGVAGYMKYKENYTKDIFETRMADCLRDCLKD